LPDPVFNIIACAGFALLVKWSGSKWKANGSKFLFAVLLYLGFRFIEDFSRFYLHPENWAGLSSMQWKILFSFIPLLCVLLFREKRNPKSSLPISGNIHLQVKASQQAILHSVLIWWSSLADSVADTGRTTDHYPGHASPGQFLVDSGWIEDSHFTQICYAMCYRRIKYRAHEPESRCAAGETNIVYSF
jgi:hypothetical protein